MYSRGGRSTGINAKNYIGREADARLQEVLRPIQQQGTNALNVDWVPVDYYQLQPSNTVCTCRQVQVTRSHVENNHNPVARQGSAVEIEIDWKRPLFGTANENRQPEDDFNEDDLTIVDEDNTGDPNVVGVAQQLFGASEDCGICFRSGTVPAYSAYNRQRILLCTHHVANIDGYHIQSHLAPNVFEHSLDDAFVEFEVTIPKYFKSCKVSLWNNRSLIQEMPASYLTVGNSNLPISLLALKTYAGKTVTVRVTSFSFTHLVLDFDLGLEKVHANFAQMSKSTDWTMLDTLGQLNIILPMTINQVSSGDVLYVPTRKQAFKVTDVTYLQTALNTKLDWSVQTRVLQPSESLHNLRKGMQIVD